MVGTAPLGSEFKAPESSYSRLFPLGAPHIDDEKLVHLGSAMLEIDEREGLLTPRTGYTYFGQFVGHDLSDDRTPFAQPYPAVEKVANYRSPYLDLEHVYDGTPTTSPHLFCGPEGEEQFKVGRTTSGLQQRDLAFENDQPVIALNDDRRNLENLMIRQLHVLFLKLHNVAVTQLRDPESPLSRATQTVEGTVFARAKRVVQWHYQWIVRHDYLPRITHPHVWTLPRKRAQPPAIGQQWKLPIEFALAVFRFGHSMVRRAYALNCRRRRVEIDQLMQFGRELHPLQDELVMEWGRFLDGLPRSGPVGSSSLIDTSITRKLHGLDGPAMAMCSRTTSDMPVALPVRTLIRGAHARIASGQQVAKQLVGAGIIKPSDVLTVQELVENRSNRSGSMLAKLALHRSTPLFYYILKEAEMRTRGRRLGTLGSYIVADVLQSAIESDPTSYINIVGPNWALPYWRYPSGREGPVNSVAALVRLVGDTTLLPGCKIRQ